MSDEDESVVRAAYEAYGRGEVTRLLELVAWQSEDRSYLVLTMDQGRIVALRNFQDRGEARSFAGLGQPTR